MSYKKNNVQEAVFFHSCILFLSYVPVFQSAPDATRNENTLPEDVHINSVSKGNWGRGGALHISLHCDQTESQS